MSGILENFYVKNVVVILPLMQYLLFQVWYVKITAIAKISEWLWLIYIFNMIGLWGNDEGKEHPKAEVFVF